MSSDFVDVIREEIEKTEKIKGLGEIQHSYLAFDDYELVLFDKAPRNTGEREYLPKKLWYVKPKGMAKRMGEVIFSKPELLISLIKLGDKIEKSGALEDELALSEDIIEWCKKFGLPYEDKYFRDNYRDEKPVKIKNAATGYTGFCLREFKRRVAVLYGLFNLWLGLTYNDRDRFIRFSPLVGGYDSQKDHKEQITQMKDRLAQRIWTEMGMYHISLALQYDQLTDKYIIAPRTSNLIAAAYSQLAMKMTKTGEETWIKFCSKCGDIIEVSNGNKRICSKCDRDYHRDFIREARKKGKYQYNKKSTTKKTSGK